MHLVYAGQDERKMNRLWRKERKLEAKLAGRYCGRPKGMHWRTFERISTELNDVLGKQHRLFIDGARRLLDRMGWPPPPQRSPRAQLSAMNSTR